MADPAAWRILPLDAGLGVADVFVEVCAVEFPAAVCLPDTVHHRGPRRGLSVFELVDRLAGVLKSPGVRDSGSFARDRPWALRRGGSHNLRRRQRDDAEATGAQEIGEDEPFGNAEGGSRLVSHHNSFLCRTCRTPIPQAGVRSVAVRSNRSLTLAVLIGRSLPVTPRRR